MNSPLAGSIVPRIRLHLQMDWQLSRDWLHLLKWNLKSLRVGVPIFPPLKKENWIIKVEIKKTMKESNHYIWGKITVYWNRQLIFQSKGWWIGNGMAYWKSLKSLKWFIKSKDPMCSVHSFQKRPWQFFFFFKVIQDILYVCPAFSWQDRFAFDLRQFGALPQMWGWAFGRAPPITSPRSGGFQRLGLAPRVNNLVAHTELLLHHDHSFWYKFYEDAHTYIWGSF